MFTRCLDDIFPSKTGYELNFSISVSWLKSVTARLVSLYVFTLYISPVDGTMTMDKNKNVGKSLIVEIW
jgi:hypothetical protein